MFIAQNLDAKCFSWEQSVPGETCAYTGKRETINNWLFILQLKQRVVSGSVLNFAPKPYKPNFVQTGHCTIVGQKGA